MQAQFVICERTAKTHIAPVLALEGKVTLSPHKETAIAFERMRGERGC
jgi:hypothetical protein